MISASLASLSLILEVSINVLVETSGGGDVTASALFLESQFEEIVYERLRSLGYSIDKKVGYSGYKIDLAVVHPDELSRYILAIECDGGFGALYLLHIPLQLISKQTSLPNSAYSASFLLRLNEV